MASRASLAVEFGVMQVVPFCHWLSLSTNKWDNLTNFSRGQNDFKYIHTGASVV